MRLGSAARPMLLTVGVAVAVSAVLAANAGAAGSAMSWSSPVPIDLGGAPNSLSCPSSTFCAAVDEGGTAVVYKDGAWAAPQQIDGRGSIDSVSCVSASFCMSVDFNGNARIFNGSSWSAPRLAGSDLTAVSCASASFCMAVTYKGDEVTFNGSSWSEAVKIDGDRTLEAVSCASRRFCVATDDEGNVIVFGGGAWQPPYSVGAWVPAVSCVSESFCMAVDVQGNAISFNGSSWHLQSIDGTVQLRHVSCASASFCVATDSIGGAITFDGSSWVRHPGVTTEQIGGLSCPAVSYCVAATRADSALTFNGTSFSAPTVIGGGGLRSISCASFTFCAALDGAGRAVVFSEGAWQPPVVLGGGPYLSAVSCVSSSFCAAVSLYGQAFIYDGAGWSAPANIDPGNELTSVSCASSSFCVASDGGGGVVAFDAAASVRTELEAGVRMTSVSCVSRSFCVLVDSHGDAFTYNGLSWSAPVAIDSREPASVSCASESFCVAVDEKGYETTYDGLSWSVPRQIDANGLAAVSCASPARCVAVGAESSAVSLDGSAWSAPMSIDPDGYRLHAVSCAAENYCAAVDDTGHLLGPPPPRAASAPTVHGIADQGQTLTEAHAAYEGGPIAGYAYLWQDCNTSGRRCSQIAGATGQTHMLTAAEIGHAVRVEEIAANISGSAPGVLSMPTPPVMPAGPTSYGAIEGAVTEAATAATLAGVQVCARATAGGSGAACVRTGSDGGYAFEDLPAGIYTIEFSDQQEGLIDSFYRNGYLASEATPVEVIAGAVTSGIDEQMVHGASISGTITEAATGTPLEDVEVCATARASEAQRSCAATDANGRYTIAGLAPLAYLLSFEGHSTPHVYLTEYYENAFRPSHATLLQLAAEQDLANIDATMSEGGSIGGTIFDRRSGAPIADARACAIPVPAEGEPNACVHSNTEGEYKIGGLAPGDYRIRFTGPSRRRISYLPQYYYEQGSVREARVLRLPLGVAFRRIYARLLRTPPAKGVARVLALHLGQGGSARLKVRCEGRAGCSGKLKLLARIRRVRQLRFDRRRRRVTRTRKILLAATAFAIPAGETRVLHIRLTRRGRRLLRDSRHPVHVHVHGHGVSRRTIAAG